MRIFGYSLVPILIVFILFNSDSIPKQNIKRAVEKVNIVEINSEDMTSRELNLTEEESIKLLFEYIYPEKEYYHLATKYPVKGSGGIEWYKYEFVLPKDQDDLKFVRRIESYGLEGEKYYIFGFYTDNYSYDGDGVRSYSNSNYASSFAVNIYTGEVIREREDDEKGVPKYNKEYSNIFRDNIE